MNNPTSPSNPTTVDITSPDITILDLYKIMAQEQKALLQLQARAFQTQSNIAAIEAEILKRTPKE
jgi:hypothetical protein